MGWIKANFDAHVGTEGHCGLGVVVRNHEGKLLLIATRRIRSHIGTEESEADAACFALEIARIFGYDRIHLEGDALSVINAVKRNNIGLAPIFNLYESLEDFSNCFLGFMCSFVRRSGNIVAHMIARWDTSVAPEKVCMDPFPDSLRALIDLDLI